MQPRARRVALGRPHALHADDRGEEPSTNRRQTAGHHPRFPAVRQSELPGHTPGGSDPSCPFPNMSLPITHRSRGVIIHYGGQHRLNPDLGVR